MITKLRTQYSHEKVCTPSINKARHQKEASFSQIALDSPRYVLSIRRAKNRKNQSFLIALLWSMFVSHGQLLLRIALYRHEKRSSHAI